MAIEIMTLAERPDLVQPMWDMESDWPEFMVEDPVGYAYFDRLPDVFAGFQLVAMDGAVVVGKVHALPFVWDGTDDHLPARGWQGVLLRGFADQLHGRTPTAVSLLEAFVVPGHRGGGLSVRLLEAAKDVCRRHGLTDLFGPVRPVGKAAEPLTPMADYVARTRDDGLPADPWMRTHVRIGGRVVKVCPASMTIGSSLAHWRRWTGLPLDRDGDVELPGGLVPLHVSVTQDHAVYVEPNVWIHHRV